MAKRIPIRQGVAQLQPLSYPRADVVTPFMSREQLEGQDYNHKVTSTFILLVTNTSYSPHLSRCHNTLFG